MSTFKLIKTQTHKYHLIHWACGESRPRLMIVKGLWASLYIQLCMITSIKFVDFSLPFSIVDHLLMAMPFTTMLGLAICPMFIHVTSQAHFHYVDKVESESHDIEGRWENFDPKVYHQVISNANVVINHICLWHPL